MPRITRPAYLRRGKGTRYFPKNERDFDGNRRGKEICRKICRIDVARRRGTKWDREWRGINERRITRINLRSVSDIIISRRRDNRIERF